MSNKFYRGSSVTFKFTPKGGLSVTSLGTPYVSLVQDLVLVDLSADAVVDSTNNCVTVTLDAMESARLVPGAKSYAQVVWVPDEENEEAITFPPHEFEVLDSPMVVTFEEEVVYGESGTTGETGEE